MKKKLSHPYRKILDFLKPYEQFHEGKIQTDMAVNFRFNKKDCRTILKELRDMGYLKRNKKKIGII